MAKWLTPSERTTVNAQPKFPNYRHRSSDDREKYPSKPTVGPIDGTGTTNKPRYTGSEVIGIATMHKSNAVPVTGKGSATDIARMRRG